MNFSPSSTGLRSLAGWGSYPRRSPAGRTSPLQRAAALAAPAAPPITCTCPPRPATDPPICVLSLQLYLRAEITLLSRGAARSLAQVRQRRRRAPAAPGPGLRRAGTGNKGVSPGLARQEELISAARRMGDTSISPRSRLVLTPSLHGLVIALRRPGRSAGGVPRGLAASHGLADPTGGPRSAAAPPRPANKGRKGAGGGARRRRPGHLRCSGRGRRQC